MAYFDDYQASCIQPGYVDKEGDYELMITGIRSGQTKDGTQYTQIDCDINYAGRPHVSVFLTAGKNFNGNFTAFCDTFGISRGERPNDGWKGKTGYMHILLGKKDGFVNMTPRYILGTDNFVMQEVKNAANGGLNKAANQAAFTRPQQQQTQNGNGDDFGDIPF